MRRVAHFVLAAALAVAASSAIAQSDKRDLVYRGNSMLTENLKERPYWTLQASCSGFFGATSNYFTSKGDKAQADAAKDQGVAFYRDAVERLVRDRKVTREVAVASVSQVLDSGRADGKKVLERGVDASSPWNHARSACLDVNDTYAKLRGY